MTEKLDTTEVLLTEVLNVFRTAGERHATPLGADYEFALVQRLRAHCYRLGQHATTAISSSAGEQRWLRDLLAVVHRDGGHHTERVGTEQSTEDAKRIVSGLLVSLDEAYIDLSKARDELAVLRAERKVSQ